MIFEAINKQKKAVGDDLLAGIAANTEPTGGAKKNTANHRNGGEN